MLNKYSVITISHYFYPRPGGLEFMAYSLAKNLADNGDNVLAIFAGNENSKNNFAEFDNIQMDTFKLFNGTYPLPGLKLASAIWSNILLNPQATVVIHDRHLLTSFLAALSCKVLNRKYILVSHTTTSNYFKNKFWEKVGNVFEKTISRFVVKAANKVVAVSTANLEYLHEHHALDRQKSVVIHNLFSTDFLSAYKIQPKEKAIVFATKWIPVKDPDTTLSAFTILAKNFPDWKFYFIGEGESAATELQDKPRNLIIENRMYSKHELYSLLSKSYGYINSSLNEGLSVGIIEAAALGNRVVVSDAPSNLELATLLRQKSYTFGRQDPLDLVKKVTKAIENYEAVSQTTLILSARAYKQFADTVILQKYGELIRTTQNTEYKLTKKAGLEVLG